MRNLTLLSCLLGALALPRCAPAPPDADATATDTTAYRDTYVVLLDLSDRLLTDHQVARDLYLVRTALDAFVAGVAADYYAFSPDRFKVVVAPQARSAADYHGFEEALTLDLGALPPARRREVATLADSLYAAAERLYRQASRYEHAREYQGADLWRYFKDRVALDFATTPGLTDRNRLVVLTDGYLDFERYQGRRREGNRYASTRFVRALAQHGAGWRQAYEEGAYGIIAPDSLDLRGVRVAVVEVNPRADYHAEVLEHAWREWLAPTGAPPLRWMLKGNRLTAGEQLSDFLRPASA